MKDESLAVINSETLKFTSKIEAKELLKILFEDFPTLSNHTEPLLDNFCILPLEEGIQGQRFYIPSLHEVLCVENSSDVTQLRTAADCGYWGSMKNIDGHAMRYDHKHKSMRWVIFGYLDGGTHTNLPYLPADLIAGMCNGEKLNLPAWVKKSQSRDMNDLKIRLSLCSVNRDSITDSPSLSATKIQPIACQGFKRRVADFADISFANKGICISLFGFKMASQIKYTITNDIPLIISFCHNHENNSEKELTHTPTEIKSNTAVLSHRLKIVQQKAANKVCPDGHQHLRCAEYQCVVNFLLIEMFMNRNENITLLNIDDQEASAKQCLTYFGNWQQAHLNHRKAALRDGQDHKKQFLSPITYNNLRITVTGFFCYARLVLTSSDPPQYVPFLHSNTSSLESHFSQARAMNADTPRRYGDAVAVTDASKARIHINNSKSYSAEDMEGEKNLSTSSFERFSCRKDKMRGQKVIDWLENAQKTGHELISYLSATLPTTSKEGGQLKNEINSIDRVSYLHYVLNHPDFIEYSKISIGTTSELWFKQLYSLKGKDINLFNRACQGIVGILFLCFETNITAPKKSIQTSYYYQVFNFQTTNFQTVCDQNLPNSLLKDYCGRSILLIILSRTLSERMYDAGQCIFKKNSNQNRTALATPPNEANRLNREEQNEYTNRFVGWAIREVNAHWKHADLDIDEAQSIMVFIDRMKMIHDVAILDKVYMNECYSISDQIHNKGGLTLVSIEYFDFGRELVSKIYEAFNEERMKKDGPNSLTKSFDEIEGDRALQILFLHCDKSTDLNEDKRIEIMKRIIRKTMHAMSKQVTVKYNEEYTGHYSKNGGNTALRQKLKASSQIQSAKKKLEFDEMTRVLKEQMKHM